MCHDPKTVRLHWLPPVYWGPINVSIYMDNTQKAVCCDCDAYACMLYSIDQSPITKQSVQTLRCRAINRLALTVLNDKKYLKSGLCSGHLSSQSKHQSFKSLLPIRGNLSEERPSQQHFINSWWSGQISNTLNDSQSRRFSALMMVNTSNCSLPA